MYNGIGLTTPRGSGTNGYVQRNLAFVSKKKEQFKPPELKPPSLNRKPNKEILEHERKRKIELKCVELEDLMEQQGYSQDDIDKKVIEYRESLIIKHNELPKGDNVDELERDVGGRIKGKGTHEAAMASQIKDQRFRNALNIESDGEEKDPNSAFDFQNKKLDKMKPKSDPIPEPKEDEELPVKKSKKSKKLKKHKIRDISPMSIDEFSSDEKQKKKKHKKKSKKHKKEKKNKKKKREIESSIESGQISETETKETVEETVSDKEELSLKKNVEVTKPEVDRQPLTHKNEIPPKREETDKIDFKLLNRDRDIANSKVVEFGNERGQYRENDPSFRIHEERKMKELSRCDERDIVRRNDKLPERGANEKDRMDRREFEHDQREKPGHRGDRKYNEEAKQDRPRKQIEIEESEPRNRERDQYRRDFRQRNASPNHVRDRRDFKENMGDKDISDAKRNDSRDRRPIDDYRSRDRYDNDRRPVRDEDRDRPYRPEYNDKRPPRQEERKYRPENRDQDFGNVNRFQSGYPDRSNVRENRGDIPVYSRDEEVPYSNRRREENKDFVHKNDRPIRDDNKRELDLMKISSDNSNKEKMKKKSFEPETKHESPIAKKMKILQNESKASSEEDWNKSKAIKSAVKEIAKPSVNKIDELQPGVVSKDVVQENSGGRRLKKTIDSLEKDSREDRKIIEKERRTAKDPHDFRDDRRRVDKDPRDFRDDRRRLEKDQCEITDDRRRFNRDNREIGEGRFEKGIRDYGDEKRYNRDLGDDRRRNNKDFVDDRRKFNRNSRDSVERRNYDRRREPVDDRKRQERPRDIVDERRRYDKQRLPDDRRHYDIPSKESDAMKPLSFKTSKDRDNSHDSDSGKSQNKNFNSKVHNRKRSHDRSPVEDEPLVKRKEVDDKPSDNISDSWKPMSYRDPKPDSSKPDIKKVGKEEIKKSSTSKSSSVSDKKLRRKSSTRSSSSSSGSSSSRSSSDSSSSRKSS